MRATLRPDELGTSVSVWGDTAIAGAPNDNLVVGVRCWLGLRVRAQRDELDRAAEAHRQRRGGRRLFGLPVAILGDTVVVGAHLRRPEEARFGLGLRVRAQRDELDRAAEAHRQRRCARDKFGILSRHFGRHGGDRGQPRRPRRLGCGSAYVFVRSGTSWTEQQLLTASDPGEDDLFGCSVACSGGTALIGAWMTTIRREWARARPTCSRETERAGASRRSSWRAMRAAMTASGTRLPSRTTWR